MCAIDELTADTEGLCAIAGVTVVPQGEHGHLIAVVPVQSNVAAVAECDQQLPILRHFLGRPAEPGVLPEAPHCFSDESWGAAHPWAA